ncbi:PilZ domain-containing protein [Heliorestis convoluta]|uniref:Type iv pilus assembly protein pilz, putative n=1 Tax=Heliorestis convoluta TaxID=356322 RepID=A0A5Q2MZB5_9FIRM|nr:PilZ domain-containing protein [Heliorestis convoluta]QGG46272.1 type iv pilus assembly protein pilz, putative [Heliorestis convoluta]
MKCRRNYIRINCSIPAIHALEGDIAHMDEWVWYDSEICNISLGGMLLSTGEKRELGEQIWIEFTVEESKSILVIGLIRYAQATVEAKGTFYKLGIQFQDILETDRDMIARYITQSQLKNIRKK